MLMVIALAYSLSSAKRLSPSADNNLSSAPVAQIAPVVASQQGVLVQERYGYRWMHYATVSRSDGSFREMFIAADNIDSIEVDQPLPNNTLILMESWYSPESLSTVFIKQKLSGTWQYGSFSPDNPGYRVSDRESCHRCHQPFSTTDFTLTKPLLAAALSTQKRQVAYCDRPGRQPCEPRAYQPQ